MSKRNRKATDSSLTEETPTQAEQTSNSTTSPSEEPTAQTSEDTAAETEAAAEATTDAPEAPVETAADTSEDNTATTEAPEDAKEEAPVAETTETVATPATAEPEPQKAPATWPGKLALVISVAALGCAGYLYWQSLQQQTTSTQQSTSFKQTIDTQLARQDGQVTGAIDAVKSQLQSIQAAATTDRKEVESLQTRLTQSIQQVTANQPNSRADWLLAEVEYLFRLANQRVLMEKTPEGALNLLNAADGIIKEIDDVSIYDVRKALATDIAALEAVPALDAEGIFLKLDAMNSQVDNLKRLPLKEQRELPELLKEITPDAVSESWTTGVAESWNNALDKLGSLVIIQQTDEAIKPLLSPEQMFYLQQNLHLMLEQAQLSVLQRKQATYDASLTKAEGWLNSYFDPSDSVTQALLKNIATLKQVNVNPELPDISGSLKALKGYLLQMAELTQQGASQ